jgi:hypothetical protein
LVPWVEPGPLEQAKADIRGHYWPSRTPEVENA